MFKALGNLTKAVVSVVAAVPAAAIDAVMMPCDASEGEELAPRTSQLLRNAGDCVKEAIKQDSD